MTEKKDQTQEVDVEKLRKFVEENLHKVRNCVDYQNEYDECTSMAGRFHQYFVDGEFSDCSSWKEDAKNCEKSPEDLNAFASIINHENERKARRLKNHYANDVWKRRTHPPENWNAELPEWAKPKLDENFKFIKNETSCVIF